MIIDIEKPFFDSYRECWAACINTLEYYYELLSGKPQHYKPVFRVSGQIVFATNIMELKKEITSNLEACKGLEAERYMFSLIEPFKGFGEIIHKDCIRNMGDYSKEKYEAFCDWVWDIWQDDEVAAQVEEQAAAAQEQAANTFHSVISTFNNLLDVAFMYSNMLDGALLSFGIDLLQVQKQYGITLITKRDLTQLSFYCGTTERALLLINRVEQAAAEQEQAAAETELPQELNTDEAKKYIQKAINLGLMDDNYKWLRGLQMCACFARDMSIKLNLGKGERISWKPFETLFGLPKGKLRLNLNDIQKTGSSPKDTDLIDAIFE